MMNYGGSKNKVRSENEKDEAHMWAPFLNLGGILEHTSCVRKSF